MEICAFFEMKTHFFWSSPQNSWKLTHILKTFFSGLYPGICGNPRIFRDEDFCFSVHTLEFEVIKFLWPPKNCLCPPSRATLALYLERRLRNVIQTRVAETGGDISPPIIWLYPPPIVWVWSTSASPPIIRLWCASERRCPLAFGEKSVPFLVKTFFFCSSLNLLTWTKSWSRYIPPMLILGQNWGKIANYPPQCSAEIDTPNSNWR